MRWAMNLGLALVGVLIWASSQWSALGGEATTEEAPVVIPWRDLVPVLPKVPDAWTAAKPKGQTHRAGNFALTVVSVEFTKGEAKIEVKISDHGSGSTVAEAAESLATYESDTEEGYTKGVSLDSGLKGNVTYSYEDKHGQVMLGFAKRFMIDVSANGVENTDVLLDLVKQIDTKRLSELAEKNS